MHIEEEVTVSVEALTAVIDRQTDVREGGDERGRLHLRSTTSGTPVGPGVFMARNAESFAVLYPV